MTHPSLKVKMTGLVQYSTSQPPSNYENDSKAPQEARNAEGKERNGPQLLSPADLIEMQIGSKTIEKGVLNSALMENDGRIRTPRKNIQYNRKMTQLMKEDSQASIPRTKLTLNSFGQALESSTAPQLSEILPSVSNIDSLYNAQKTLVLGSASQFGHMTIGVNSADSSTTTLCGTLHAMDLICAFIHYLSDLSRVLTNARSAVFEYVSLSTERMQQLEQLRERISKLERELEHAPGMQTSSEDATLISGKVISRINVDLKLAREDFEKFEASLDFEEQSLKAEIETANSLNLDTSAHGEMSVYQSILKQKSVLLPQYIDEIQSVLYKLLSKPVNEVFPRLGFTPKERSRISTEHYTQSSNQNSTSMEPMLSLPIPCEDGDNALEFCRVFSAEVEPVLEALTFPKLDHHGNVRVVSRYALLANITRSFWPEVPQPFSPAFADQSARIAELGSSPFTSQNTVVPSVLQNGPASLLNEINHSSFRSPQLGLSNVTQLPADCLVITAIETFYTQIRNSTNKTPLSNTSSSQAHGLIAVLDRAGRLLFTFTWLHAVALLAPSTLTSFPVSSMNPRFPLNKINASSSPASQAAIVQYQKELENRCKIAAKLMSLTLREFHLILTSSASSEKFIEDRPDLPYWWSAYILPQAKPDQKMNTNHLENGTPIPAYFLRNAGVSNICIIDPKLRPLGGLNLLNVFQNLCDFGISDDGESRYQKMLNVKSSNDASHQKHSTELNHAHSLLSSQSSDKAFRTREDTHSKQSAKSGTLKDAEQSHSAGSPMTNVIENKKVTNSEKPKSKLSDDDAWEAEMAELHKSSMALNALHSRLSVVLSIGEKAIETKSEEAWNETGLNEYKQNGTNADDDGDDFWEPDDDYDDPEVAYARFLSEVEAAQGHETHSRKGEEDEGRFE